jgi:hypothetical protein
MTRQRASEILIKGSMRERREPGQDLIKPLPFRLRGLMKQMKGKYGLTDAEIAAGQLDHYAAGRVVREREKARNNNQEKDNLMSDKRPLPGSGDTVIRGTIGDHDVQVEHIKSDLEFDEELGREMAKRTDKLGHVEVDLAMQVKQAREFLSWSATHMREAWFDWMTEANKALADMRMLRMSLETESKLALASAGDVRKFFLTGDHVEEVARLKDLVATIERLKALKADGTLDAIADTILKLDEPPTIKAGA